MLVIDGLEIYCVARIVGVYVSRHQSKRRDRGGMPANRFDPCAFE